MKTFIILIAIVPFILYSCKHEEVKKSKYGNTLRINEPEYIRTLYPQNLKDVISSHVITQLYEGLVKFDAKTLRAVPAIAKSWEVNATDTIYTFHLRNDVYFHDNKCFSGGKGRKVVADDVKYTYAMLCTKSDDNKNYFGTLDKVVGTYKYYEESSLGKPNFDIEGIKVINDSTLQICIEKPIPFFLNLLANPVAGIIPKEGVEEYGINNYVGSGPYMLSDMPKQNEALILLKNQQYYGKDFQGNSLPYIDSVKISFIGSTHKELESFENGELDVVLGLPLNFINDFFEKHKEEFHGKTAKYIMEDADENANLYNLKQVYVSDLFVNSINFLDFSRVQFKEPLLLENQTDSLSK